MRFLFLVISPKGTSVNRLRVSIQQTFPFGPHEMPVLFTHAWTSTTTTIPGSDRLRELCFLLCCTMMADPSGRPLSSGVARRRRERRLRSMLRHERMTVAMALAEFSHHSSRGQRMARAGVWEHEQNYAAKVRKPPTPQPELFSLEEEAGGGLPAPLSEVAGRQDMVVRLVMDDLGSVCPCVQILDLPVPQMVGDVTDTLRILDFPDCRAGYRSSQDLLLAISISFLGS